MFRPTEMRKLRLVVLARDVPAVTAALGRLGVLHLRSSVEESGGLLQPESTEGELKRIRELSQRLEGLCERLGVDDGAGPEQPAFVPGPPEQIEALINTVERQAAGRLARYEQCESALADAEEILRELEPYKSVRWPLQKLADSLFVSVRVGTADRAAAADLRASMPDGILLLPLGEEPTDPAEPVHLMGLSTRRRRFAMETVLQEHGFQERPVPTWEEKSPADVYVEALRRRVQLQERIRQLRQELEAIGRPFADRLRQARRSLAVQEKLYEAQRNFGSTWATSVISGWLPAPSVPRLTEAVLEVTGGQAVLEVSEPTPEEIQQGLVPSEVELPKWLAPFARLVHGYGVAAYTEIEPTVLFAVSFLLMFGVMFGDAGHGLCLVIIGLVVRRYLKGEAARDGAYVLSVAGATATLFGTFFQGAFFGFSLKELGFPFTLDYEPLRLGAGAESGGHMTHYLMAAIVFGIVVISLGIILNIVNRLRRRDYAAMVLGRFGLVGMIFYWGSLGLGLKLAVAGAGASDPWVAAAVVVLPLLVLAFHEPIQALLGRSRPIWTQNPVLGVFTGLVEAVETVTVYLSNTLSFLRVAAFALSHAALCFTIFVVQRLVGELPGGPVWSVGVFVTGTAVIIGLEGLVVIIQIIRLEYYEFFTKFFAGNGVRYEPFRLE